MNERFMDMLKEYLKKNERKAIGYSEEEITKIEKLYDIEAKGDFREFLKYAGRCDGDLLGDDPVILYRQTWSIQSYLRKNYFNFIDEDYTVLHGDLQKKPFIFSIEMETYYFYIRTADDNLKVYCFDENEEILKDTGMNFNEYMVDLVERYNPELKPTLDFSTVGELMVQCDTSEKRIIGLKEIREYISSERKETSEIFILFEKYLEKSKKKFTGYNDDEIRGIEELYDVEVKGDFREYLSIAGKSLGGLLGKKEFLLYSDIGVRERILLQFSLEKELRENELYDIVDEKFFILDYKNNSEYIFITTKNNGKIYYYSKDRKILKEVENNFNDYIVKLIKKYNRSLVEIKNDITSGNILNII
ncbi:SMI1/KNR4 family protein [Leptotrichia wadei]|uniref:SMI1/KNR4 family protein n=1 Tax=Leptotrichia wadei TaxID=157687 RepID=UPI0028EFED29|nr:SMI1/KNR4 family protein [Leptotrichia wadei]